MTETKWREETLFELGRFTVPGGLRDALGLAEYAQRSADMSAAGVVMRLKSPRPLTPREAVEMATLLRTMQGYCGVAGDLPGASHANKLACRDAMRAFQPLAAALEALFPDEGGAWR